MPDQAAYDMTQIDRVSEVVGEEGKSSQRTLLPGESLECETLAVAYSGLSSVSGIAADGSVRG